MASQRLLALRRTAAKARRWPLSVIVLVAWLHAAVPASAVERGATDAGHVWVSGGVSSEELQLLHAQRRTYTLWVATVEARTGAHLADVRLVVRDAQRQALFDGALAGPWFLIDLPPGRYTLEATLGDRTERRAVQVRRGDLRQVFFRFATGDQVAPDYQRPFERNPYDERDAKK